MKLELIFTLIKDKPIRMLLWKPGEYFIAQFIISHIICGVLHTPGRLYGRTICLDTDFVLQLNTWEFLEEDDNKYWELFFVGN